jgi:hypothetical protein
MDEDGTFKPVGAILRRGEGRIIRGGEPNWGTLYTCMGMSQ